MRDLLFFEKHLFKELAESEEGIPTNVLADRLKRLEGAGILDREAYQDHPPRYAYRLTKKGMELFPVLKEIIRWGMKHFPGIPHRDPAFLTKVERRIKAQGNSRS